MYCRLSRALLFIFFFFQMDHETKKMIADLVKKISDTTAASQPPQNFTPMVNPYHSYMGGAAGFWQGFAPPYYMPNAYCQPGQYSYQPPPHKWVPYVRHQRVHRQVSHVRLTVNAAPRAARISRCQRCRRCRSFA